jgi:hypothetical protein
MEAEEAVEEAAANQRKDLSVVVAVAAPVPGAVRATALAA